MENTAKSHPSTMMPLLPISNNPSNPILSQSIMTGCFAKLVLVHCALLLALGTFTLLCVFMYTSIISEPPKIRIDSFFVSKLKVSNTSLGANWDVAFTIENRNLVSWVRFKCIEGSISYEDNPLSKFPVEPFELGLKEHKSLRVKISTTVSHECQPAVKELVFEEIKRQHDDGATNFNMHVFA
ncbi:hypothetical protein ACFX13_008798 [Malus domestica]|uniref:Late embryogenesis abundant protein LEA-2 subgroup domain-containing protein n=1 Tax=Malus domestica TaxID=3750 RepID=A0A498IIV6_MALDO|nr:hypothetical protein DVH24_034832 [Malus domestica]